MIIVWWIIGIVMAVSMLLTTLAILRGPTTADRILGLDLLAILLVGGLSVLAVTTQQVVLLDVALVVTATAFASTLAMVRRIQEDQA